MGTESAQLNISGLLPNFNSLAWPFETAEQLSAFFFIVILITALVFLFMLGRKFYLAWRRISWVCKHLKNEKSFSLLIRQDLLDKASELKPNSAGHLWKEFNKTLVEAKEEEEVTLHSIYSADHFFNTSTLASELTESRSLAIAPGVLTACGVIGTFVGLQLGLSELNISNDVAIEDMKTGLAHVINGAKIAFMTSVWGVVASVLYNIVEKMAGGYIRSRINSLQILIDQLFPRFSPEMQLQKIADDGAESREALQGLAERIGEKMQESLHEATSGIQHGLEASLEKIMAPALNRIAHEATDGSQKALENLVEKFLEKFGEQGAVTRDAMDIASKGVGDAMSLVTASLQDFTKKLDQNQIVTIEREKELTKHIASQIDKLVQENKQHGEQFAEVTQKEFSRITELVEQSHGSQQKRESQLSENFETAITNISHIVEQQSVASNTVVEQGKILQLEVQTSQSKLTEWAQGINEGAIELRSAAECLQEYGEDVKHSSHQLSTVIQEAANSTAGLANENQKSATLVSQIHQQLSHNMETLKTVSEKLNSVIGTANSTFENLGHHQQDFLAGMNDNMQDFANQAKMQTSSSGTLIEQGKALQHKIETSLSSFEILAQKMNESSSALHSATDNLKEYGEGVQQSSQQLGIVIREAANSTTGLANENQKSATLVSQIHQQTDNVATTLSSISEQLDSIILTADSTFDRLGKQHQIFVSAMDKNMQEFAGQVKAQGSASDRVVEQGKVLQNQVEISLSTSTTLIQKLNETSSELHSATSKLKDFGAGVQKSTQQLGDVINNAAHSTAGLASENQKSAAAVGQVHQQISHDIVSLDNVIEKLESVIQRADTTFDNLKEHQQKYLAALKENVEELAEQGAGLLHNYAEQANLQTEEHLRLWVSNTTDYAETMNQAVKTLSNVVAEIEDKLSQ